MTTKRPQKWQRLGYKSADEYAALCAATRRTKRASLAATKTTLSTNAVFRVMWDRADFHRPYVTITTQQLMDATGIRSHKTIREAWRTLRAEGSIKGVSGTKGGRGVATEFRLYVAGETSTPSDEKIAEIEDARKRDAAWQFLSKKYGPVRAMQILNGDEND